MPFKQCFVGRDQASTGGIFFNADFRGGSRLHVDTFSCLPLQGCQFRLSCFVLKMKESNRVASLSASPKYQLWPYTAGTQGRQQFFMLAIILEIGVLTKLWFAN